MKRFGLALFGILFAFGAFAQVVDSAHLLVTYVPKLGTATKINQQAEFVDTVISEKVNYTYSISPKKPELNFIPGEIKVSKLNPEVKEVLYRN